MNNSENSNPSTNGNTTPKVTSNPPSEWRGMTIEELRYARGKALIRREVGRASLQFNLDEMKDNVANNGVRALMFSPGTVSHLKTADYVLLGFKLMRWLTGLRNNSSSRRRRRRR